MVNGDAMLTMVGVSHHDAPLEVRERLAVPADVMADVPALLVQALGPAVVLSTCNRTEVYLSGHFDRDEVIDLLETAAGIDGEAAREHFRVRRDRDAVAHLLEVASGIDSMVIGEPEILGQVREGYALSTRAGFDDAVLSRLFHLAIRVGRRARAETGISRRAVSISSVAVHEALTHHPDVANISVLVLGAGDAGRAAAEALIARGVRQVTVVNRTLERAEALAAVLGGRARPFDELVDAMAAADVVIAATGAAGHVVDRAHLKAAVLQRNERLAEGPLVAFDIAMPRDFEAEARALPGVSYRDLDDLQAISEANGAARGAEVEAVRAIVDTEADRFMTWWRQLAAMPTIAAINERAEAMRAGQVRRTLRALGSDFTAADLAQQIDVLTRSLVRQLLHDPITALHRRGDRENYVAAVRSLFALDGPAGDMDDPDPLDDESGEPEA
jgi:glutamyl-tRNA reductase